MFDGVQQVLPRRKLHQGWFKHGPIKHAGAGVGLPWADHEHIGNHVLLMAGAQGGYEGQATDDDGLPIYVALMSIGAHHGSDVAVTEFINAALVADFHLQSQQRQLYLQVTGVELLSVAGLQRVVE